MAKLTLRNVEPQNVSARPVGVRRVRTADGSFVNSVNADSQTLGRDLSYIFKANVKKTSKKR